VVHCSGLLQPLVNFVGNALQSQVDRHDVGSLIEVPLRYHTATSLSSADA
jgi:hypothetical protein